jgi:hypothetical protein
MDKKLKKVLRAISSALKAKSSVSTGGDPPTSPSLPPLTRKRKGDFDIRQSFKDLKKRSPRTVSSDDDSDGHSTVEDSEVEDGLSETEVASDSSNPSDEESDDPVSGSGREWRISSLVKTDFKIKPGKFFTKVFSIEKRRRLLKKLRIGSKPTGRSAVPAMNSAVASTLRGHAKEADKHLSVIQRNELDVIAVADSLYQDDLSDAERVREKIATLLKLGIANLGHVTAQRRALVSKHFGLPTSVFTSDDDGHVPTARSALFTSKFVKDITKERRLVDALQKKDFRASRFRPEGQGQHRWRPSGSQGHQSTFRRPFRGGYQSGRGSYQSSRGGGHRFRGK